MVFLFRILLIAGGFVLIYIIGKPMVETIQYQLDGNKVKGIVIGFRGSKSSKSIFEDNTTKVGKKYKARRPVYRYPKVAGSLDSLQGYATSTIILPWMNFELHEEVNVVMDKNDPSQSHIFSKGIFFTDCILILLSLYMVKLGIRKSD
ncbi:MAG: DUF3592 domain-containing protein [Saprospiraceae bacterium]|jgi:hypothetical protein|nr:hypothetical protein [Saprospiraceae bacterium]MBK9565804.1 hypothetical protein [Saprospiraceae bacterium]MBP6446712.1 hypothetical protein [Saprospiraceae bacterium]